MIPGFGAVTMLAAVRQGMDSRSDAEDPGRRQPVAVLLGASPRMAGSPSDLAARAGSSDAPAQERAVR